MVFVSSFPRQFLRALTQVISYDTIQGQRLARTLRILSICTRTDIQCEVAHDWTNSFPNSK